MKRFRTAAERYAVEMAVEFGECDQCGDGSEKPIPVVLMGQLCKYEFSPYRFCWKCLDMAKSMIESQ